MCFLHWCLCTSKVDLINSLYLSDYSGAIERVSTIVGLTKSKNDANNTVNRNSMQMPRASFANPKDIVVEGKFVVLC